MVKTLPAVFPCRLFVWLRFCKSFPFTIPGYQCFKAFVISRRTKPYAACVEFYGLFQRYDAIKWSCRSNSGPAIIVSAHNYIGSSAVRLYIRLYSNDEFLFNVPVRLLASHLLIISVFLVLEDRQKLLNIFLLNKPANSTIHLPLINNSAWRKAFFVLETLLAISIFYSGISSALEAEKEYGWNSNSRTVPLYGVYNTTYFIRNNDTVPPIETDSLRWKQLVIDGGNWKQSGIIEFTTGKRFFCSEMTI